VIQAIYLRRQKDIMQQDVGSDRGDFRSLLNDHAGFQGELKEVDLKALDALCNGQNHQGVAAIIEPYQMVAYSDLLSVPKPLILACDQVQDPHNLGAIFRSAAVFGTTGLVLSKDKSVAVNPTVHKVSSGATWHVPAATVVNMSRALAKAKDKGLWIIGSVESGGCQPAKAPFAESTMLIVGNEERGMRPLLQKHCDVLVTIPAFNPAFPALNVASATSVLLYEAACQRRANSS